MARISNEKATPAKAEARLRSRPPQPSLRRDNSQPRVKHEITPFNGQKLTDSSSSEGNVGPSFRGESTEQYTLSVVNAYKALIESCDVGVSIEAVKSVMRRIGIPFELLPFQILQNRAELKKRITTALPQLRIIKDPDIPDLAYI